MKKGFCYRLRLALSTALLRLTQKTSSKTPVSDNSQKRRSSFTKSGKHFNRSEILNSRDFSISCKQGSFKSARRKRRKEKEALQDLLQRAPSGCGSIRTLHVDALLPAEVNGSLLLMDGGFSLLRFDVIDLVPSLVGWMCSQASGLLVYLLSWKKGVATSRNSLWPYRTLAW